MEKIEACPLCGCQALLVEDKGQYKIFCTECDCQYGWCEDKDDAIRGWNRREVRTGMAKELQPCPFCGEKPTIFHAPNGYGVTCKNRGCVVIVSTDNWDTEESAIAAWNRRKEKTMNELQPCPCCGSKAILVEDKKQYKIYCTKCECQYGWCEHKGDVIRGWNRRKGGQ